MKTQLIRNVSAALFAAASLFALGSQTLVVKVPFGFHVGPSMLPPGEYTVDTAAAPSVMRLRSADAKSSALIQTNGIVSRQRSEKSRLVFNRYGDEYFLSEVWTSSQGRALPQTKREKEVAARVPQGPQTIMAAK